MSRVWNPGEMLFSFLETLKSLGFQFSVVHRDGVDIFWNSPIAADICSRLFVSDSHKGSSDNFKTENNNQYFKIRQLIMYDYFPPHKSFV